MKLKHIRALGIEPPTIKKKRAERKSQLEQLSFVKKGESVLNHQQPATQEKSHFDSDGL